jgi:hypothetical protein
MAVPTLVRSGVTFTFHDGDVETVRVQTQTDLDWDALPISTPNSALLFDFSGVKKSISVSGELTNNGANTLSSGTAVTIDDQRKWLEQTINGNQSGVTFTSNYSSTWNGSSWISSKIYFASITFTDTVGKPNSLPFEITIYVGDV